MRPEGALTWFSPSGLSFDGLGEQRYADGLILTEWKVARTDDRSHAKFAEARAQAKLYTQGVLAGVELTTVRYAVVVSSQRVEEPADMQDGTVVYRHINVAVDPETPSKASRRSRSPVMTAGHQQ